MIFSLKCCIMITQAGFKWCFYSETDSKELLRICEMQTILKKNNRHRDNLTDLLKIVVERRCVM